MKHSEQIVSGWWWAAGSMSPGRASQLDKEVTEEEVAIVLGMVAAAVNLGEK